MPELPRILHPEQIPVAGIDDHLPPVPAHKLTADAVRERFARIGPPGHWQAEHPGDGTVFGGRTPSAASVLVPLVQRGPDAGGLHVLLTRRTEHLRDHAGQVSFPGGRAEDSDADVDATALREAEEEVGLARHHVDVVGHLPAYTTVTHFVVTPVVAIVTPPFELTLDPFEVAAAFEVPLAWLMDPANHRRHTMAVGDRERQFLSMPWQGNFIWGATAAMLRNLYRLLAD